MRLKTLRPRPALLVVRGPRLFAGAALAVLTAVTLLFWITALKGAGSAGVSQSLLRTPAAGGDWLLLAAPLALAPYWIRCLRSLRRPDRLVVDGEVGTITVPGRAPLPFDQVTAICLSAVNGTCEELAVGAVLGDGRQIPLEIEGPAAETTAIADQVARLLDVEWAMAAPGRSPEVRW